MKRPRGEETPLGQRPRCAMTKEFYHEIRSKINWGELTQFPSPDMI